MDEELKPHHYWREDRITGRLVVITPDEYEQWGKDNQPSEAYRPAFTRAQLPSQGGEAVAWHTDDHLTDKSATTYDREVAERWRAKGWPITGIANAADAQAIIDGLRGEVAEQEETTNQWRELALKFDRHRMTAMAHIRAAASGDKSAIEALGVFAALPPIPGHEITAERDQQAQRIGELEGLLRSCLPALSDGGCAALANRIAATLSAGKEWK